MIIKATWKQQSLLWKRQRYCREEDNRTLKIWSYSNLGDFMVTLRQNPRIIWQLLKTCNRSNYSYALKGIAWIVFSHERNTKEAKKLWSYRDYAILLTFIEISDCSIWRHQASTKKIGMLILLCLRKIIMEQCIINTTLWFMLMQRNSTYSIKIAKIEVNHRPTDSYDLLAWSYLNMGQKKIN
jgi:hypothetical protein